MAFDRRRAVRAAPDFIPVAGQLDDIVIVTLGGRWRFAWRGADGAAMELSGEYREVEPPARIVQTESWGGDWRETLNTLILEEHDDRTTMTQTILYPSREARDAAMESGMSEGASMSFRRLDYYLGTIAR